MQENSNMYYGYLDELDEDLTIDFKKIFYIIWSRKFLILKVFLSIFLFFVLLTFILPKKYTVQADLYINKSNNSNMAEINPYVMDENGGSIVSMGSDKAMNNELELMMSPLVIDNVIKENNIIYKKKWGIIPNKKEGEFFSTPNFLGKGKNPKFENKKNTNVITITYKAKSPKLAYGVVSSIIANYIKLHTELNAEKAKADKKLIAAEYDKVKGSMNNAIQRSSGLPTQSMTGIGNLSAMSAFSHSASQAIGSLHSQYIQGEKSRIAVEEEAQKMANLAAKLEWAKMVEEMSDSSKVLVLKEPVLYRPFEKSSPRLLIQLILGIVFGSIASLFALIIAEATDKKVAYSMLENNAFYNTKNELSYLEKLLLFNENKSIIAIAFSKITPTIFNKFEKYKNIRIISAENDETVREIRQSENIMLFVKPEESDAKLYKELKSMIKDSKKNIIKEFVI